MGIRYRINRGPNGRVPLSEHQRRVNRLRSRARARCEHVFHVVKRLWGYSKVRYRGLAKNTSRLFTTFALANPVPAQATSVAGTGYVSLKHGEMTRMSEQNPPRSAKSDLQSAQS